jgi:hypothetical protein
MQRAVHDRLLRPVAAAAEGSPAPVPRAVRLIGRSAALQRLLGRMLAIGFRPESPRSPVVPPVR